MTVRRNWISLGLFFVILSTAIIIDYHVQQRRTHSLNKPVSDITEVDTTSARAPWRRETSNATPLILEDIPVPSSTVSNQTIWAVAVTWYRGVQLYLGLYYVRAVTEQDAKAYVIGNLVYNNSSYHTFTVIAGVYPQ